MSLRIASKVLTSTTLRRTAVISTHFAKPTLYRTMASIPSTMKGVIIEETGGTDVLHHRTDLPVPEPAEGQILVKNDYIGVNYIDTYFRTGLYAASSLPYTLGREAEGTVVKTGSGDVNNLKVGDKVVWMGERAYAEYTATPAARAIKLSDGLDLPPKIAVAAFLQGMTALTMVREAHALKKGDWVLVHAAAGGTGLWLCGILHALGANTIGTASTDEKVALAKKAGATHMINYSHEDVKAKVAEPTGGKGVIAVFDGVGKSTFDLSLDVLAMKGTLVSFGNASGVVPPLTIARLSPKNARLLRPTLFGYISTREELQHYAAELFGMVKKDGLEVKIHEVYPLSEVARAHNDLEGRKTTGKLLLDPSK